MIKAIEFEGKYFRSKVPIPFVEDNFYLPAKVFIEGYFPAGTGRFAAKKWTCTTIRLMIIATPFHFCIATVSKVMNLKTKKTNTKLFSTLI